MSDQSDEKTCRTCKWNCLWCDCGCDYRTCVEPSKLTETVVPKELQITNDTQACERYVLNVSEVGK